MGLVRVLSRLVGSAAGAYAGLEFAPQARRRLGPLQVGGRIRRHQVVDILWGTGE